jgi:very-short-patch-repair endonuclease
LQDKDIYELASRHPYVTKEKVTEMLERSNEIADKCNFTITQDWGNVLPEFPVPDELKEHFQGYCQHMGFEINNDSFLKYLAYKGFAAKGLDKKAGYGERLQMELQRFIEKGYSRYFLIVWDYVQFCKKNGIRVGPARGSVAASLAAYCMDITEVDPIKYDLLYDRFISPIRKDYPDIDLDFEDTRRDEVFGYLRNKYGINNCAQVITFSRWHGRGALRDVGRIFKIPFEDIDRITRLVIQRCISGESKILLSSGESIKIKELYELYKKRIYGKNGRNKRKTAKGISWDMKSERFKKHAIKRVYFAGKKQLYEITTCLGKKIKATEEHKFLTRNGWKRLKELTKQDEIMVFSKEIDYVQCKVCGEILKEVNSDHLEKHQMNKKHYIERFGTKDVCKEVSKKKGWQLGVPYYGKKLFGADNPMADAKVKRKWYKRIIEKDRRKKHSIWMKRNNPMYNKEIASKVMKNFCEVFRNGSKPQRLLLKFVKKNYDGKVKFDYYLRTKRSFRWLDVALVKEKIDFEFDGSFWHHNKRKEDAKRRKEIREMGWKVISIKDNNLNETVIRNKMEELKCLKK